MLNASHSLFLTILPHPPPPDRAQTVSCLDAAPTISHKRQQILIPPQTWSTFHNTSITSIIVWRKFRYPNIHFNKYSYLTNTKYWQNAEIKIHFPRWFFPIDFLISWNKLTKALHLSDALASLPYRQLIIKIVGMTYFCLLLMFYKPTKSTIQQMFNIFQKCFSPKVYPVFWLSELVECIFAITPFHSLLIFRTFF